jgi:hypothetical protein
VAEACVGAEPSRTTDRPAPGRIEDALSAEESVPARIAAERVSWQTGTMRVRGAFGVAVVVAALGACDSSESGEAGASGTDAGVGGAVGAAGSGGGTDASAGAPGSGGSGNVSGSGGAGNAAGAAGAASDASSDATVPDGSGGASAGGHCAPCGPNEDEDWTGWCVTRPAELPEFGCATYPYTPCGKHGMWICENRQCALVGCHTGWGDCDGDETTGCETPLDDRPNCGACGVKCVFPERCDQGTCIGAYDCPTGPNRGICGGACVDFHVSERHCGSCDNTCTTNAGAGDPVCNAGVCDNPPATPGPCASCRAPKLGRCFNGPTGCVATCGAHATICTVTEVVNEIDQPPLQIETFDICVDTRSNSEHCGACGQVCNGRCVDGACINDDSDVLATVPTAPQGLSLGAQHLYVAAGTDIVKISKLDGASSVVISLPAAPAGLRLRKGVLYWHASGALHRLVDAPGSVPITFNGVAPSAGWDATESAAFFIGDGGGTIERTDFDGSPSVVLYDAPAADPDDPENTRPLPTRLVVDETHVYFRGSDPHDSCCAEWTALYRIVQTLPRRGTSISYVDYYGTDRWVVGPTHVWFVRLLSLGFEQAWQMWAVDKSSLADREYVYLTSPRFMSVEGTGIADFDDFLHGWFANHLHADDASLFFAIVPGYSPSPPEPPFPKPALYRHDFCGLVGARLMPDDMAQYATDASGIYWTHASSPNTIRRRPR